MTQIIDSFSGENECYSNFSNHSVSYMVLGDMIMFKTSEHAYQASKATTKEDRDYVADARTPGDAKRRGRRIQLRQDWEPRKEIFMMEIIYAKAIQHREIAFQLLRTGNAILIEGNFHGDDEWGMIKGSDGEWKGENKLGKTWVLIRDILTRQKAEGFWQDS